MKKLVVLLMMVMVLGMSSMAVVAGDGNGGGDAKLEITDASTVVDGQTSVAVDEEIKLVFSNNVVNMKVKDNNMACFTMTDGSGTDIAIEVVMGDDQIDKDIKNDVIIKPSSALKAGESYTITVNEAMVAKNGSALGKEKTITFETATSGTSITVIVIVAVVVVVTVGVFAFVLSQKKKK